MPRVVQESRLRVRGRLQKICPPSFGRLGKDNVAFPMVSCRGRLPCGTNFVRVVPVDSEDFEAKPAQDRGNVMDGHYFVAQVVTLKIVLVNDRNDRGQFQLFNCHEGLVTLPLLHLTVA